MAAGKQGLASLASVSLRWILDSGNEAAPSARWQFMKTLHQSLPIFGGGAISTVAVSAMLAVELKQPLIIAWAGFEAALMAGRLVMTWQGRRSEALRRKSSVRGLIVLELLGAASIGYGAVVSILSGTWLGAIVGWMSATSFVGETSIRILSLPRLAAAMVTLGTLPAITACLITNRPALIVAALLTSLYVACMIAAARRLNAILVTTMRAERENDHRARHDTMTGLLNRAGLEREIDLMRSEHPDANLTLFFVDLDGFKLINDTFGHSKGDRMLRIVADRLLALAGSSDIVARIGGDEFVIITALQYVDAAEFGAAILAAVKGAGSMLGSDNASVGASVGIAQTRDHGADLAGMLLAADTALYGAKRMGGAVCVIAPPSADKSSTR